MGREVINKMTKLREAREKAGLKRAFVADKLGISPDHLNLLERGKSNLSLDKVETLATLYRTDIGEMTKIAIETVKEG
jgi:transcriptional regulator with XRE-family HTH domain